MSSNNSKKRKSTSTEDQPQPQLEQEDETPHSQLILFQKCDEVSTFHPRALLEEEKSQAESLYIHICSELYCPLCKGIQTLQGHLECSQGHRICQRCVESTVFSQQQSKKSCPICSSELVSSSAHLFLLSLARQFIVSTDFVCPFSGKGCLVKGVFEDVSRHSQTCEWQSMSCSVPCCTWRDSVCKFQTHLVTAHVYQAQDSLQFLWTMQLNFPSNNAHADSQRDCVVVVNQVGYPRIIIHRCVNRTELRIAMYHLGDPQLEIYFLSRVESLTDHQFVFSNLRVPSIYDMKNRQVLWTSDQSQGGNAKLFRMDRQTLKSFARKMVVAKKDSVELNVRCAITCIKNVEDKQKLEQLTTVSLTSPF